MYIIYSKKECINCSKAKLLLHSESKIVVECDELLKENRSEFIKDLEKKMKTKFRHFPVIFIDDIYLGDYQDLVNHLSYELVEEF